MKNLFHSMRYYFAAFKFVKEGGQGVAQGVFLDFKLICEESLNI